MSLIELAERVEKASGPAFVLDRAISDAMGHGDQLVRPYSASLDAAMALVPEGLAFELTTTGFKPGATVCGSSIFDTHEGAYAATPTLALCAAALRARAQQEQAS